MIDLSKLLNTKQAAQRCRVSEATMRRWAVSRKVPSVRRTRTGPFFFHPDDLDRWVMVPGCPDAAVEAVPARPAVPGDGETRRRLKELGIG